MLAITIEIKEPTFALVRIPRYVGLYNKMLNLKRPSFMNLSLLDRFSDIVEMYKHVHICSEHSSLAAQK